jgi:hypothetical protein
MNLVPTRHSGPADRLPQPATVAPVAARIAQEGALAALIGGNLFGRVAMHPALADISDKTERGRVLNHAWRRYGTVNSLSLVALVAGWAASRPEPTRSRWHGSARSSLVLAKDIAVGAVVVTGLASAAGGVSFAHQAPDGAVPMDDGAEPSPETPPRASRLKHAVNVLGGLNLAAELSLVGIDALLRAG